MEAKQETVSLKAFPTYRLKPLPKNTNLDVIIELINLFQVHLYCYEDRSDIDAFIEKHPDLVCLIED